jgi:hypothetical protein
MYIYNGTPGPGTLLWAVIPFPPGVHTSDGINDPYGNHVYYGEATYTGSGPAAANTAMRVVPDGLIFYTNPSGQGQAGYSFQAGMHSQSGEGFQFQPGNLYLAESNGRLIDPQAQSDAFYPVTGVPTWLSGGNLNAGIPSSSLDRSQTDPNTFSITSTTLTALTKTYVADKVYSNNGGALIGTAYTVKTWFNGRWAGQAFQVFVHVGPTNTHMVDIAGAFVPGIAAGDTVSGWLELSAIMVTATTARCQVTGAIMDNTIAGGASNVTGCTVSSQATTLAFDPTTNGSLGITGQWLAAGTGQIFASQGSTFSRKG